MTDNVLMIHIGRSGSTVVADQLQRHPMVKWDGELFKSGGLWHRYISVQQGMADPIQFLQKRIAAINRDCYGFEFKFYHTRMLGMELERALDAFFHAGITRAVVLKRKNFLRKIVSSKFVLVTGIPHIPFGEAAKQTPFKLELDNLYLDGETKPLIDFLDDFESNFRSLGDFLKSWAVLNLTYEEDVQNDPRVAYRRICEFLNIPFLQCPLRMSRTTPFKLSEVLINYDEVVDRLADTRFAWMTEAG